jgi:hypothetical protein
LAQTNAPSQLPPAAQEAMKKGITAAKQKEWEIAIRSFQEARKTAPDAPEVFYNLGLAESKMPGRELRAIAWFGAYLSATANAPNASAVKDKIAELQIKNEGNTLRLIKSLQDAASQMSGGKAGTFANLFHMAELWAKAGDYTAAVKTADLIEHTFYKGSAQCQIARAQAEAGEAQAESGDTSGAQKTFAEAQKTADLIQSADSKSSAQSAIAKAQAKSGITNARNSTRQSTSATEPPVQPAITVSDWLKKLDELNTEPFLDLTGYLKSLPKSDDPQKVFESLRDTATKIVTVQNVITRMLKEQAGK